MAIAIWGMVVRAGATVATRRTRDDRLMQGSGDVKQDYTFVVTGAEGRSCKIFL